MTRWTPEEDELLRLTVLKVSGLSSTGPTGKGVSWAKVAKAFPPNRKAQRCRERWLNYLDPQVNRGPFLPLEDEIILQVHHSIGTQWVKIAEILGTNRTGDIVKHRAHKLLKKNPQTPLAPCRDIRGFLFKKSPQTPLPPGRDTRGFFFLQRRTKKGVCVAIVTRASTTRARKNPIITNLVRRQRDIQHFLLDGSNHPKFFVDAATEEKKATAAASAATATTTAAAAAAAATASQSSFKKKTNTSATKKDTEKQPIKKGATRTKPVTKTNGQSKPKKKKKSKSKDDMIQETREALVKAWNRQLTGRRKGEWNPSGGWKPPIWHLAFLATMEGVEEQEDAATHKVSESEEKSRRAAARVATLITKHMQAAAENELGCVSGNGTTKATTPNSNLKGTVYLQPSDWLLVRAHAAMSELLPDGDCETIHVLRLVVSYYNYWRPPKGGVKVILLAESHAFTSEQRAFHGPGLDARFLSDLYDGPREYLSLVYSFGYGEDDALSKPDPSYGGDKKQRNAGTAQFWSLFAAISRGTSAQPIPAGAVKSKLKTTFAADVLKGGRLTVEKRLLAKLKILQDLKARGIWLLDTSMFGWYMSQPQQFKRSQTTNEVHRKPKARPPPNLKMPALLLAWEMYTKHVVRQVAEEGSLKLLIPIGKNVWDVVTPQRLEEAVRVPTTARNSPAPQQQTSCHVAGFVPAPNSWMVGGYGPYYTFLAELVAQAAPRQGQETNDN